MEYSAIRDKMQVGDVIGCRSNSLLGRIIRRVKGGEWDLSHVAMVIRDTGNEGTGRVEVLEALTRGGMQKSYLSKTYRLDHGKLFWVPMNCSETQRQSLMELGAEIQNRKVGYDFFSTCFAMFSPIFVDIKKFNCSEFAWYMLTEVGRVLKRLRGFKEIAPVPGDLPAWAGVEPVELSL